MTVTAATVTVETVKVVTVTVVLATVGDRRCETVAVTDRDGDKR